MLLQNLSQSLNLTAIMIVVSFHDVSSICIFITEDAFQIV